MTEITFISYIAPILIYIFSLLAIVLTVFFYFQFKEKMEGLKTQYQYKKDIEVLIKENKLLQDTIVANIKVS
tara:strand:- start:60 stop:275 length:216 start_codon:yes stop_codon:yes gene_type:complete